MQYPSNKASNFGNGPEMVFVVPPSKAKGSFKIKNLKNPNKWMFEWSFKIPGIFLEYKNSRGSLLSQPHNAARQATQRRLNEIQLRCFLFSPTHHCVLVMEQATSFRALPVARLLGLLKLQIPATSKPGNWFKRYLQIKTATHS